MTGLRRMATAWFLAIVFTSIIGGVLTRGVMGLLHFSDGMLGIGLIVGVPMLLFALLVGFPLSFLLHPIRPAWLCGIISAAAFAAAAWMIGKQIFPTGWGGAAMAYTGFAAAYGLIWGVIGPDAADTVYSDAA